MIRINLLPTKKKRTLTLQAVSATGPGGQWVVLVMLATWMALGGAGYWALSMVEGETAAIRQETAKMNKEIEDAKKSIDFEGLEQRKNRVEQLRTAIQKLKAQQQTPVYVMHELVSILTTGQMPDIDEEEWRRIVAADPQSELQPNWDATGVWIKGFDGTQGSLSLTGGARDATDIAEFTRRIRASSYFGVASHADYRVGRDGFLDWKLTINVRRWD